MSNKYGYLAKNSIIFTVSSFSSKFLAFLLVPFYTSVLTKDEFGTADLVLITSALLVFVVTLCIYESVIRFAIDNAESRYGVFNFGFQVVSKGCLVFLVFLVVFVFFNPIHWDTSLYIILFFSVLFNSLNQLVSYYLRAIDQIVSVAVMGLISTVSSIVLSVLFLLMFSMGVSGYLLSFVFGCFLSSLYGFVVICKKDIYCFRQYCDPSKRKMMLQYSIPLIFNGLAWWINSGLDRYFIVAFFDTSFNGIYAAASKIPSIVNVISQIFCQAWNISAIKEFDENDKEGFFRTIYSSYNFILVFSSSLLILFNVVLSKILFSNDYFDAWMCSSVLVISSVFAALSGFLGGVFNAIKKSKIFALSTVIAAMINAALNYWLIPQYGLIGAAIATAISFFVIWLIRFVISMKFMKLQIKYIRDLISYIFLSVQSLFDHLEGHCYLYQCIIVLIIVFMYRIEILYLIKSIRNAFAKYFKR